MMDRRAAAAVAIENEFANTTLNSIGEAVLCLLSAPNARDWELVRHETMTAESDKAKRKTPTPMEIDMRVQRNDFPHFVSCNSMVGVSNRNHSGCLANSQILKEIGSPTTTMWTKNPETRSR